MLDAVETIFLIMIGGEFIMGILGNGFIGLVNFIDWIKKRKIYLVDLILTSLAISRIGLLFVILLNGFITILYPEAFDCENILKLIDSVWTITNQLSVCFATCLSIFYCLKIANFSHPLFLWLKWRINTVILIILLASLLKTVLISLLITEKFNEDFKGWGSRKNKRNYTGNSVYFNTLIFLNLETLLPFTLSVISFCLLILSLWKHTRKIKLNAMDARDPRTEIHLRAMKAVISFLILFVIYCLAFLITTSSYFLPQKELAVIFGEIIAAIYPSGHSFILILGNIKLKQASLNSLKKMKHCLKGGKSLLQAAAASDSAVSTTVGRGERWMGQSSTRLCCASALPCTGTKTQSCDPDPNIGNVTESYPWCQQRDPRKSPSDPLFDPFTIGGLRGKQAVTWASAMCFSIALDNQAAASSQTTMCFSIALGKHRNTPPASAHARYHH
ncbi:taste receptor type 2 member 7-like [Vombatus ursinus]|uniref:taste receptor type 2 member 7-like n=1 Tax=Vombatus ursinus TaxID=29139 RepID=UPI000FFD0C27|nr:taste receptor type 2 member 7-like [Vombatus ursinus]